MDISGMRKVTPSKPRYWEGTRDPGQPFTREQRHAVDMSRGRFAATRRRYGLPASFTHRIRLDPKRDQVVGDIVSFDCPVVSCRRDRTQLCVIAPNGYETWVPWVKA